MCGSAAREPACRRLQSGSLVRANAQLLSALGQIAVPIALKNGARGLDRTPPRTEAIGTACVSASNGGELLLLALLGRAPAASESGRRDERAEGERAPCHVTPGASHDAALRVSDLERLALDR